MLRLIPDRNLLKKLSMVSVILTTSVMMVSRSMQAWALARIGMKLAVISI